MSLGSYVCFFTSVSPAFMYLTHTVGTIPAELHPHSEMHRNTTLHPGCSLLLRTWTAMLKDRKRLRALPLPLTLAHPGWTNRKENPKCWGCRGTGVPKSQGQFEGEKRLYLEAGKVLRWANACPWPAQTQFQKNQGYQVGRRFPWEVFKSIVKDKQFLPVTLEHMLIECHHRDLTGGPSLFTRWLLSLFTFSSSFRVRVTFQFQLQIESLELNPNWYLRGTDRVHETKGDSSETPCSQSSALRKIWKFILTWKGNVKVTWNHNSLFPGHKENQIFFIQMWSKRIFIRGEIAKDLKFPTE